MTIERQHNGSYLICTIVGSRYYKHVYYGYTRKEACAEFRAWLREERAAGR